jgi:hypothetical protein
VQAKYLESMKKQIQLIILQKRSEKSTSNSESRLQLSKKSAKADFTEILWTYWLQDNRFNAAPSHEAQIALIDNLATAMVTHLVDDATQSACLETLFCHWSEADNLIKRSIKSVCQKNPDYGMNHPMASVSQVLGME